MWCARSRSVSLRSRRAEVVRRRECSDVREMRPALLLLVWAGAVAACGPGRGFTRRRSMRRPHPLVYGQHEPNVSENIASGHPEGRITKNDTKFKDLVPNYNEDIFFKDEEGTGADRLMTQRCKEKLNTLAISVMNQWPGVRLRVIEGWEEEDKHSPDSLHYEGRAVDLTTSDRDYSKNGLLARLAAEAGFDWVYYESRSHIHCSVKTESSVGTGAGCFPEGAVVHTERGPLDIAALRPGDRVLASDEVGKVIYSEVLTFLDRKPNETRRFVELGTDIGKKITTTPSHLLLLAAADGFKELFAADVRIGDTLLTWYNSTVLKPARVTSFKWLTRKGAYAPLTAAGTIIVDDTLASCYALVRSQSLAHAAMAPLRWLAAWTRPAPTTPAAPAQASAQADGVHWYARALYSTANYVLPSDYIYL